MCRVDRRDYVGPTAIRAAVLPARAVYLVADGSADGMRRAVREACTRWGGMTEPIIPVKPGGDIDPWWRQVAQLARADGAVNVDADPEDATVAAGRLGLELVPLADIDLTGLTVCTVHPSVVGPEYLPGSNAYVIASHKQQLWEVTGAGDLTDEHLESLSAGALSVRRPYDDEVARAQLAGRTLVERTCSQFREHWTLGMTPGPAVVWISEPDSFKDCVFFWNLRALRPLRLANVPMLLLPYGQVQHWMHFTDDLAYPLERPAEFTPDVALCSLSVAEPLLHETAALLGLQPHNGEPGTMQDGPAPARKPPFTYRTDLEPRRWLNFERAYGEITDVDVQLFRETTTVRFTSPVSSRGVGAALVRLSGAALEGLPRRSAIADRIASGATWSHGALQITACAVNDYLFKLHVPELPEVTDALLSKVTVRHGLSPRKGQAGMAWLDQTDISPLGQPGVFAAIRNLTTPRSKALLKELRDLRRAGAVDEELAEIAAHWGGRAERAYKSAEQMSNMPEGQTADALERLCAAGWAERGLRIDCGACGQPSFIPLSQAPGSATCPGCSSPAAYQTGSALTIYYRLNSHLDMLSDQGVLPHLLTIAALQRQGAKSHFLPGIDVWFSQDDSDQAEADIFGVRDGQILCGEVKTTASQFTPDQIARDVDLSTRLEADTHVLAATDSIPENVIEKAKQLCTASGLGVVVLSKAELLPWG
jgi:hypothetical protein